MAKTVNGVADVEARAVRHKGDDDTGDAAKPYSLLVCLAVACLIRSVEQCRVRMSVPGYFARHQFENPAKKCRADRGSRKRWREQAGKDRWTVVKGGRRSNEMVMPSRSGLVMRKAAVLLKIRQPDIRSEDVVLCGREVE